MTLIRIKIFLQLIAIAHILGGISLPFLVSTPLFASYNTLLYQALGFESTTQNSNINFLVGPCGIANFQHWSVHPCAAQKAHSQNQPSVNG